MATGYPLQNALFQWEEGHGAVERLRDDPRAYRGARRAVDAIRDELRKRIGSTFQAEQLANLYAEGTDWAEAIVVRLGASSLPDPATLADAAFWQHLRGASDYAGGRRVAVE